MRRERNADTDYEELVQRVIDEREDLIDEAFRDILAGRFDSHAVREVEKRSYARLQRG